MFFRETLDESPEADVIAEYLEMLGKVDGYDRFELISQLDRFSVVHGDTEETEKMRLGLKKVILDELMKTNVCNKQFYQNLLSSIKRQLHYRSQDKGFSCCFVGCRYVGERHLHYVMHLKQCHPNIKRVLCNYGKKCSQFCVD